MTTCTTVLRSALVAATGLAMTAVLAGPAVAAGPDSPRAMARAVTSTAMLSHLESLQAIARANDGNRAMGTAGHEASIHYLESVLGSAGYETIRQPLDITYDAVVSSSLTLQSRSPRPIDHNPITYSPATPPRGVTAELVTPATPTGCLATDWVGQVVTGRIALVTRGGCTFAHKAEQAHTAGAVALLVANNEAGGFNATFAAPDESLIPASTITRAEGATLLAALDSGPVRVTFALAKVTEKRQTYNLIAQTPEGRDDNVVMVGARLDSPQVGPGINEAGSAAAALLETAVQLAAAGRPNNTVRFAFWAGQGDGLGADAYLRALDRLGGTNDLGSVRDIATYIDVDVIGSPNYVVGIYDADTSSHPVERTVPHGSTSVETLLSSWFDANGQAWIDVPFEGHPNATPFITKDIAVAGVFSGTTGMKSEAQADQFGGVAARPYDPNYRTSADTVGNVSAAALELMGDAVASTTFALSRSTAPVNGLSSRRVPSRVGGQTR